MWRSTGHRIGRALRNHALRAGATDSTSRGHRSIAAHLAVVTAAAATLAWTLTDASDPLAHARAAAAAAHEPMSATLHLPPPAAASASATASAIPTDATDSSSRNNNNPTAHPAAAAEKMRLTRRFTRRRQTRAHTFVIVGSGTTAHAAIEAIRQEDPLADILVLSDEAARPRMDTDTDLRDATDPIAEPLMETYNEWRRHLTAKLEDEPNESSSSNAQLPPPLTLLLDKTAIRFDVERNRIHLGDGTEIRYTKCLIAASGQPRHCYVLDRHRISYALKDRINLCTTLSDFAQLDQLHKRSGPDAVQSVVVIGGGFLGTEVATALATDPRNAHMQTRLVFTEAAPTSRSLPLYLAHELTARLERVGVTVVPDHLVTSLKCEVSPDSDESEGNCPHVVLDGLGQGTRTHSTADFVVLASTHTDPNLRIGRTPSFEVDEATGGIVVNAQLEAISGLFVAGNAASYFDPYLGRRRVDRYDHAVNSGLVAGRNMVASLAPTGGKMQNYRHQPMFRSHLRGIDVVIEGIGEIDATLRTVGVWVEPPTRSSTVAAATHQSLGGARDQRETPPVTLDRGVVYYLKGNKIMGILLWNASDVLESAKQLLLSRPEMHDNVLDELAHAISLAPSDWLHVVAT